MKTLLKLASPVVLSSLLAVAGCSGSGTALPDASTSDTPVILDSGNDTAQPDEPVVSTPDATADGAADAVTDAPPADVTADAVVTTCEPSQAPDGACGTCLGGACCQVLTDCAADSDCYSCVTTGGGPVCNRNADTRARAEAYWACESESCPSECLGVAPGDGGAPVCSGFATGECGTCLEANCCQAVANCQANQDCLDCATGGGEAACHRSREGHSLAEYLFGCVADSCMAQCQ